MPKTYVSQEILNIRAELMRKGMTFRGFARKHGFPEDSVCSVMFRYGHGIHKIPTGIRTTAILQAIQAETGIQLVSALEPQAEPKTATN